MVNLKSVLQATGWNGTLMAHLIAWIGDGHDHRVTRYKSTDPNVIAAQLSCMQAIGIDGVIVTWQGPFLSSPSGIQGFTNVAARTIINQCALRGMKFALLLDPWVCKSGKTPADKAALVTTALKDPSVAPFFNNPAYIPERAVLDFSTGADLALCRQQNPTLAFWAEQVDYSWPNTGSNWLTELSNVNLLASMKVPAVCPKFFDGGYMPTFPVISPRVWDTSIWGPGVGDTRNVDHQAGNTFLDTVGVITKSAPYAGLVTWNDHDEGTGIEDAVSMLTGIRIGS